MNQLFCQKGISFLLIFLAVAITRPGCLLAAERTWMRSEILAIADAEAKRLGYDVEQMTVSFDRWDHCLDSSWKDIVNWKKRLENRNHWAVAYSPIGYTNGETFGRMVFLFVAIDRDTGQLIESFQPQYPKQTGQALERH